MISADHIRAFSSSVIPSLCRNTQERYFSRKCVTGYLLLWKGKIHPDNQLTRFYIVQQLENDKNPECLTVIIFLK